MQSPMDEPPLCAHCDVNVATESYTLSGHAEPVCATCLERAQVRDAFDDQIPHLMDLERREQYDEELACLDAILEANRHRDHDRWLARMVARERALILFKRVGRYAEAEQAYHAWAQLGFGDATERYMYALGTAEMLELAGRDREALAVLEDALSHEDDGYLDTASHLLAEVARHSEKLGQPVDPKWRPLAEAVAEEYAIDMPTNVSFGQALRSLRELTRSAKPKRLREQEQEHGTDPDE